MSQGTVLLWVMLAIGLATLAVWIVQFVRSRRGSGSSDGRAGWWEGPWEEDDPKR